MGKITYTNKVALNENPEVADINKVTDDDMNEIKSIVNTNDDNVGDITTLTTTIKTSTVSAINELNSTKATSNDVGNIANLTTTDKTSVVNAVNELNSNKASKNEVIISDTQPSASDNKLWIDTGEIAQQVSEITNEYSTSTGLGYSANYINNMSKVLWTNPDPTQNFEAQTITLNDNINNYTYYEVIYRVAKGGISGSSSKVLISMGVYMYYITNFMARRVTSAPNGTSMVINEAYFNGSYGQGATVNNELLIPVQVIGYK